MENHDLHHEFPTMSDKIHELKVSDNHFRKLFDEYHEINHQIQGIESGAEAVADEFLNALRIKRLRLKDKLYAILIA